MSNRIWRVGLWIGLWIGFPLLAIWANLHAFALDQKASADWSGPYATFFDASMVVVTVFFMVCFFLALHTTTQANVVTFSLIAIVGWFIAPAYMAVGLYDTRLSGRGWAIVAWHWALDPLPIEIEEVFGWTVPNPRMSFFQGAAMVVLQMGTLGLVVGAAALLIRRFSSEKN